MKIYGVSIKFPHSGELTRSVVLTLLKKEVLNNYSGRKSDFNLKSECQRVNRLHIEDVNGSYRTSLS